MNRAEAIRFLEQLTERNNNQQQDRAKTIAFAAGKLPPEQDNRDAVKFLTGKGRYYRETN